MSVRAFSPAVALLTAATLPLSLVPTATASPYVDTAVATLSQGDLIYNDATGQECAVGWLHDGYAFTAGQCGADGDLFRDIDNNYLGTFETDYDEETRRNDFGWIKLDMEVAEGENEYELIEFDDIAPRALLYRWGRDGGSAWSYYEGFDGTTMVGDKDIAESAPVLGEPVMVSRSDGLAGLYTGEMDGLTLITRPDRQALSPRRVDAAYVVQRRGNAQHADVYLFSPDTGRGAEVELPGPAAVDQGMKIVNVTGNGRCTIGYIGDGVVYSAGHCGDEGDEIWLSHDDDDRLVERIGTFHTKYKEDESLPEDERPKVRNDHGYITLESPWVQLGSNVYSGDKVVHFEDIKPGLEVCAYGQTTKPAVRCGEVLGVDGADIVMSEGVDGQKGDSGGPVWAKDGSGLVGIFSGGARSGEYATASYPYAITDNNNEIHLDSYGILRAFARSLPYYSVFAVYQTYLGVRGEKIPTPGQPIGQGDLLYDWEGKPVCRVGYVKGNRIYYSTDCRTTHLYTNQGGAAVEIPSGRYYANLADTGVLVDSRRWDNSGNLDVADRMVPWDELSPGDEICTTGASPEEQKCTTLLGLDGPRLILKDTFEGDFGLPGGPLWVPGKGFAGVYAETWDEWGRGMRIDMVFPDESRDAYYTEQAVRASELGETFYQRTPTMYADDELNPTSPVSFPKRKFQAGDTLYDAAGNEGCEVTRVEAGRLVVSSECGLHAYTRLGEYVGYVEEATSHADQVATIEVDDVAMSADKDTVGAVVPWDELTPGDRVCAGGECAAFVGYDGSMLVLDKPLTGVLPGAALRVAGKGVAGMYHRDGIGSRLDMVERDRAAESNAVAIRAAYAKGERFYAHNDADFWSLSSGRGERVPFPSRSLDESTMLYDAHGTPTCHIGHTDGAYLYVSSACGTGAAYTAAGEYIGEVDTAPAAGNRDTVATIEVTGHRMEVGTNTHKTVASWDVLQPGDTLCSAAGCGTFAGLDGAQVIHDAPVPNLPGAALWNPEHGFVGVSGGAGKPASRIDMVTEGQHPSYADQVKRAREWGVPFYQRAAARFWSPAGLGDEVPFESHPSVNQGDLLYDANHHPTCTIGFINDVVLYTAADCAKEGTVLYSEFGEPLGALTVPAGTSKHPAFGYVQLDTPYVEAGTNTKSGSKVAAWDSVKPGDKVCAYGPGAGERCGTYYGQDGAAVVLSGDLDGDVIDHGGPVWVPGKGLVAIDAGRTGNFHTGARIDMLTHGTQPTNYKAVQEAYERGEEYFQRATAHFFTITQPKGAKVPFPKKPVPTPTPDATVKPEPTPTPDATATSTPTAEPTAKPSPETEETAPRPTETETGQPSTEPSTETTSAPNATQTETEHPAKNEGSADGSSTGGIIAAILIPLLLLGIGFLVTQVVDVTQFGLPPVPQVLRF